MARPKNLCETVFRELRGADTGTDSPEKGANDQWKKRGGSHWRKLKHPYPRIKGCRAAPPREATIKPLPLGERNTADYLKKRLQRKAKRHSTMSNFDPA